MTTQTLDPDTFSFLWQEDRSTLDAAYPFVPLTGPGMPLPGLDFCRTAESFLSDKEKEAGLPKRGSEEYLLRMEMWLDYLYRMALYQPDFCIGIAVRDAIVPTNFIPGHLLSCESTGPRPAKAMIIGEKIGYTELSSGQNFSGRTSRVLFDALAEIGVSEEELCGWYVTNVVRHIPPDPSVSRMPVQWIKNCLPLLAEEFRLVRPEFVLCLGATAAEHVIGKKKLDSLAGQVFDIEVPISADDPDAAPTMHVMRAMAIRHPAYVARTVEALPAFKRGLQQFCAMVRTGKAQSIKSSIKFRAIYDEQTLWDVVNGIVSDPDPQARIVAVDSEWHGELPGAPGSYLRTIQFSARDNEAFVVVLRHAGGEPAFRPNIEAAVEPLRKLLIRRPDYPVCLGGHFLRADAPWLIDFGVDIRPSLVPPASPFDNELDDPESGGGWDTGFELHAIHEAAPTFELEQWATYYSGCHRYDVELEEWVQKEKQRLKAKDLGGYGNVPDDILFEYGAHDAVHPRRMHIALHGTHKNPGPLRLDSFGNDARQAAWISQAATLPFLEMEMRGVLFDMDRAIEMTQQYEEAYDSLLEDFRAEIRWPTFNPQSIYHCRELLFGEEYNGAKRKERHKPVRLRPEGALCLGLSPIKSAGNKSKSWDRIKSDGEEDLFNPSTDKETLGIFGTTQPIAQKLRDIRFIGQVLKNVLARPERDREGNLILNEHGEPIFEKGAISFVRHDGRLHTRFFPLETGRSGSSRPPLQNWSKRRESDYKRILGDRYKHPIRSILMASPGFALVEVDLASAEMAALGWLSQDETMIEHVRRNQLPEDHPDFLDMHSAAAVKAFRLNCAPTKNGLKSIGKEALRVAAKGVNFGIPYGRGDEAIARQCREEITDGTVVTIQDAAKLRREYQETYPRAIEYLEECAARVQDPGWICGGFLRYRRFFNTTGDQQLLAEMERQAKNFPIQNLVADAVQLMMWNLYAERECQGWQGRFYFLLQIHDAVIFEVPLNWLEWFTVEVIPKHFARSVPIFPRDLNGELLPVDEPYYFGVTIDVFKHWGEKEDLATLVKEQ